MTYYKINESGQQVFSDCRTIRMPDGAWVSNPTAEQIAAAGWQEYVPPVVPPVAQQEPDMEDVLLAVKKMLASSTAALTDEEALDVAALFSTWASHEGDTDPLPKDLRLWHDGRLWRVIQPHMWQADYEPGKAPALFTEVSLAEWPEWVQPLGAEDAYALNAQVSHNGKHWISDYANNTWEPGVFGWHEE